MEKVAIFLDGGYLQKVLQKQFYSAKINFSKLSELLANGDRILRTYYYNCLPYKSIAPTAEESRRFADMQRFVGSLEYFDNFEVRLGKLEYRGKTAEGKLIFQQKRVDILLGCDLVLLSAKQKISKAILLTGDSDFIPAIEVAKNEGVEIELAYSNWKVYHDSLLPHESLIRTADTRHIITQAEIDRIKLV